jgi:serpin B
MNPSKSWRRASLLLALGVLLVCSRSAFAAHFVEFSVSLNGKVVLETQRRNLTGQQVEGPDVVWRHLKQMELHPKNGFDLKADRNDPLMATLKGEVTVDEVYDGKPNGRVRVSLMKLVRETENDTWKVAPGDVQRTLRLLKRSRQKTLNGSTTPSPIRVPDANDSGSDLSGVVQGNNAFAFDLYAKLSNKPGNLCCSPASISTALAMTYAGARGQTADAMAKTMHFNVESGKLHPMFRLLLAQMNGKGEERSYQLRMANALWGQKGHGFLDEFLDLTKTNYGAGLRQVDFKKNAERARQTINAWVEKETNAKIQELLKPDSLNETTRLVLTNAVYFKGDWESPFQKRSTHREPFHVSSAETADVMMMHSEDRFKYFDGGAFQALEMPYRGKHVSMLVLLPKEFDDLAEFEKTLTARNLAAWLHQLRERQVAVSLPKFKATGEFSLRSVLSGMGMKPAFLPASADFSGVNGERDLFINEVVHKSLVEVNEKGTMAAAATAVGMDCEEDPAETPDKPAEFIADHPFVFVIRDDRTGSILFLGRIVNPEG